MNPNFGSVWHSVALHAFTASGDPSFHTPLPPSTTVKTVKQASQHSALMWFLACAVVLATNLSQPSALGN